MKFLDNLKTPKIVSMNWEFLIDVFLQRVRILWKSYFFHYYDYFSWQQRPILASEYMSMNNSLPYYYLRDSSAFSVIILFLIFGLYFSQKFPQKKRRIFDAFFCMFFYWFRFIEFMTALICASDGLRPICINIALIMFSLIGGFFWSCLLRNHLVTINPIINPPTKQPIRAATNTPTSIFI